MRMLVQHPYPSAGERGAVAIIVAMLMTVLFMFALSAFAILWLIVDHTKTQNAVDAVALGYGDQIIINKFPIYANRNLATGLPVGDVLTGNTQPNLALSFVLFNNGFVNNNADNPVSRNAWAPPTVLVSGTMTSTSPVASLLSSFTGQPGSKQYTVTSRAQVNQIQISDFVVSPARVFFLLDFSKSMRLYYAGHTGDPEYAAVNRVRIDVLNAMNNLAQQFNFGVRVFGTTIASTADPVIYKLGSPPPTVAQVNANNSAIEDLVRGSPTVDNGTNTALAITDAITAITANPDPLAGAPILILISDGEPDSGPGISCSSGGLASCVQQADNAAKNAMQTAWSLNSSSASLLQSAAVQSFSFLINRENDNNLGTSDAQFMQSVAGNQNQQGSLANFYTDSGDPSVLGHFLNLLPVNDFCVSEDLSTIALPPNVALPQAGDWIAGYYTLGSQPGGDDPSADVYAITQAMSLAELMAQLSSYPKVDPTNPTTTTIPSNPGNNLKDVLNEPYPGLAKFYYDPQQHRVWLNSWLCFNQTFKDTNPAVVNAHFRMRWGAPQLQYPNVIPNF